MKYVFIFILNISLQSFFSQNFNRPVPNNFTAYEFEKLSDEYDGNYLFTSRRQSEKSSIGILDNEGYLIWFYTDNSSTLLDFKYNKHHNKFLFTKGKNQIVNHFKLNTNMEIIDTTKIINYSGDIHEQLYLDNGNTLIVGKETTIMDLSSFFFNGTQGTSTDKVVFNVIQEFDSLNNLVFEWNTLDHLHPDEFVDGFSYVWNKFDYAHINSIDIDDDGHILISARHLSSCIKINHNTGDIIWRLGGELSDFTFSGSGISFLGEHDFRRHADRDTYSIFDNANVSAGGTESRAIEYDLDTTNWIATENWVYKHTPGITAPSRGNHHINSDSFHLINWGNTHRPDPTFTLVNESKNIVSNLYLADSFSSYRSYAQNFEFDRPVITCNQSNKITLTAPSSNNYFWSTGETSQSITINSTGEYMVWTEKGIGFVGSELFEITNLINGCENTEIQENNIDTSKRIIGVYNLLGNKIAAPIKGNLYIIHYDNGTSKKQIWKNN